MADSSRRLDLGNTGKVVADQQQLIIDKLSKLIEKAEEQQKQQQQQQAAAAAGSGQSKGAASPADDSKITSDFGEGDAENKRFPKGEWGKLPPKERQQITQKLGKDLPSHYKMAIDAYFRKMARNE